MLEYVTKDYLIGAIVQKYPESIEVFNEFEMHCLGCHSSRTETLEQACNVHMIEVEKVVTALNMKITEIRGE